MHAATLAEEGVQMVNASILLSTQELHEVACP
jgi:hypothetical protein